jgi:hypothetical protein
MKLKFFAKAEHVVHVPGPKRSGQLHNYVGRSFVLETDEKVAKETRVAGQHRATKEAFAIDLRAPEADDLIRSAVQGGLWPADAETAAAIGVPFTKLKYDESAYEWLPELAAVMKPSKSPAQPE